MSSPRRAAFGFILATVFLEALSFGLIFPVLPRLVLQVSGGDMAASARAFGIVSGVWALANFFAAPALGAASDRFGRRPVLVLSAFGFALDLVIMALAPSVAWLVVGRALGGLMAGNFATASAYLADVSPPETRAARFGLFGAVYGAGMILGPAAGGLLGQVSPRAPFWAAAALAGLMWLYGLLVVPESLPPERRVEVRGLNPFAPFAVLEAPGLPKLAAITTLLGLAGTAANTLFVLYVAQRFGWGAGPTGLLLTVYSAGNVLVMGVLGPRLAQRLGERTAMIMGLALSTVGFAALALAPTPLAFCLASVPTCLGNLCGPPLQALCANAVPPDEQGRLQGAMGGLSALAGLVGPIVFTQLYAWVLSQPGGTGAEAMLAGSGLLLIATLIGLSVRRKPA